MMQDWLLALFFMVIAFTYASVGFGGGSSYLALLAFSGLPFFEIRLTALICNIIVVCGGTLVFSQYKQIDVRKTLPLLVASVPLAFLGAQIHLSEDVFFRLLGVTLVLAAALLWFQPNPSVEKTSATHARFWRDGILGGSIGCLSGMVGIGGGIFLSPLLHFFRWDTTRKIAAAASVFILVNSLAGIAGQIKHLPPDLNWSRIVLLGTAVLIGGQMGSRISMVYFTAFFIRRLTAVLVFVAGLEVLLKH